MNPTTTPRAWAGSRSQREPWTDYHQYLYSLVWSAFLDLDYFATTKVERRNFRPYSTEQVLREFLRDPEIGDLGIGSRVPVERHDIQLHAEYVRTALWSVAPNVFSARMRVGQNEDDNSRYPGDREKEKLAVVRRIFRREFHSLMKVPYSAATSDLDARSLLPPLTNPSIGHVGVEVVAGRRSARARFSCPVQLPLALLGRGIDPTMWWVCGFWEPSWEEPASLAHGKAMPMELLLPGGNDAHENKSGRLDFEFSTFSSPFETRVDYQAKEHRSRAGREQREHRPEYDRRDDEAAGKVADTEDLYRADLIDGLHGYVKLEKIAGRPGWTQVSAERWIRFESPNHDRFRVETLTFWFALELLSYVRAAKATDEQLADRP